ncbi:hypothetical protein G6F66_015571 [Rhizopus arrhizus]|nr:hypothetical protein G6F66_015571 [Rhizopus arrhizus]
MAGGLRPGRTLKGAIPGGVSMPVLTAAELKGLPMDYDTIRALGSGLVRLPHQPVLPQGILRPVHPVP